jgi:DNA-binding response OmpR family regulator
VARLRKYFENKPQSPQHIITHREKGYEFKI